MQPEMKIPSSAGAIWNEAKEAFDHDGSLRNLYILKTDVNDWQTFIDFLRQSEYTLTFRQGEEFALPKRAEAVFAKMQEIVPLLSINIGGIILNCHFCWEEDIELDLLPTEVNGPERCSVLFAFMVAMAQATGKDVILTPENLPETVLFRATHDASGVRMEWHSMDSYSQVS